MKKLTILLYSVMSYCVFFGTFLYMIGFIGNLLVPKSIDSEPTIPLQVALAINVGLLGLFAVQHSVMARAGFKRWITRFIPAAAERSTYVLASSFALILLVAYWEPIGGVVWHVESPVATAAIHVVFALGWLLVLVSTFAINHFDLFGLRQAWVNFTGRAYRPLEFRLPLLYRIVRHPLYCGFFIGMWATPTMTVAHLAFALLGSGYIVIGTWLEERDLRREHPEYAEYARAVPRFIPRLVRGRSAPAVASPKAL
jgi:protein-S-isoprenylcysteine O-methyltransferase Ste14